MEKKQKTIILIDSHALIHRAYHALPPLTTKKGELVNAAFGFTSILLKVLRELKPDYVLAAFDLPEPTFRHIEYKEYKATRVKAPDELYAQIGRIKEVLAAFGIPVFEKAGFEADDIIGTITQTLNAKRYSLNAIIITGDLDTLQLIGENTKVFTLKKGITDTVLYDEKAVLERFGLKPEQLTDFKGLKGDPSDNIPGVKGIGEKTASDLLQKFGDLKKLYEALEKKSAKELGISESVFKKLAAGKEAAFFSRKLATIERNVPIDFNLEDCRVEKFNRERAEKLFQELEFFALIKRLPGANSVGNGVSNGASGAAEENGVGAVKDGTPKIIEITKKEQAEKLKPFFEKISAGGPLRRSESEASGFVRRPADGKDGGKMAVAVEQTGEGGLFQEFKLCFFGPADSTNSPRADDVYSLPVPLAAEIGPFKEILKDGKIKKTGHNLKAILKILKKFSVELNGLYFDVMLAAYLLNPGERDYSLPKIIFREFGESNADSAAGGIGKLFALEKSLLEKLKIAELEKVFFEIEMPLVPILAEMEENGFKIDSFSLAGFSKEISAEIAGFEKKIFKSAGAEFNINSPKQLSEIIFKKMEIGIKGLRKTAGGAVSTQASELEKLRGKHEIIDWILKYRELAKLKTTYIDALPALSDENGRIHTTFEQTITATGRLSSREPNLQNIPAQGGWAKKIRSAFLAREGFVLAAFDYSQIELRIAAALSGDEKMIKAFAEGKDIHAMTAAEINNVPEEKVTPEIRRQAKTLNFGVLYGMAAKSFSETAGLSTAEAQNFIDEYFSDFSGLAKFLEETKERAKTEGFISTLTGRRRFLPGINSSNWQLRQAAERMAINMPIQGLAADIVKMAMVEIKRQGILNGDCRLLLQVHDELIFEIAEKSAEETGEKIKTAMEKVFILPNGVPLAVNAAFGKNWAQC